VVALADLVEVDLDMVQAPVPAAVPLCEQARVEAARRAVVAASVNFIFAMVVWLR